MRHNRAVLWAVRKEGVQTEWNNTTSLETGKDNLPSDGFNISRKARNNQVTAHNTIVRPREHQKVTSAVCHLCMAHYSSAIFVYKLT